MGKYPFDYDTRNKMVKNELQGDKICAQGSFSLPL